MPTRRRSTFEKFKKNALQNPEVKNEYDKLKLTQELRMRLIKARMEAGLTLDQVAEKMHTSRSNLSRLESTSYLNLHSPKLSTIEHYAEACGKHLKIDFV
jgi:ribosome-binding protein aMBF1 (putative translation factor)